MHFHLFLHQTVAEYCISSACVKQPNRCPSYASCRFEFDADDSAFLLALDLSSHNSRSQQLRSLGLTKQNSKRIPLKVSSKMVGQLSYPTERQVLPSSYLSRICWFLFVGAIVSLAATVASLCEMYRCSRCWLWVLFSLSFAVVPSDPPTFVTAQSRHGTKTQPYRSYRVPVL
jgi:hypothetical protein